MNHAKNEMIEAKVLAEAIYLKYGYDFRYYRLSVLHRRIANAAQIMQCQNIGDLQHKILYSQKVFNEFISLFSVTVSEFFREPSCFTAIRDTVLPRLATYPYFRIWHAGCATGEEVYSMAIVLHEAGILDKCQIYATDINPHALNVAKEGVYSSKVIQGATKNYQEFGGKRSFSNYYSANYNNAIIARFLKENIVFAKHDLATESVFSEMHLVLCRNVMIYFDSDLTWKVIRLFSDSLVYKGFLCLGASEGLPLEREGLFEMIDRANRIYQNTQMTRVSASIKLESNIDG